MVAILTSKRRQLKMGHHKNTTSSKTFAIILGIVFSCQVHYCQGLSCPAPMRLKQLLQAEMDGTLDSDKPLLLPCCYDGLTARMVARAGFSVTFMTGFGVSGVNGYPDTQLVSYGEMQAAASSVAEGLASAALERGEEPIPCIADGTCDFCFG